jgi:hypothetical protein
MSIEQQLNEIIAHLKNTSENFDDNKISDGWHTFGELYEFRKLYNAALFNAWHDSGKVEVYKSVRHHDGELCFGGKHFIVVAILTKGQISNHYKIDDWDLFDIPSYHSAKHAWDGHSSKDVVNRLKNFIKE